MTARRRPEDDFQRKVLDLCKLLHLHTAHFRPAMTAAGRWITPVSGDGKGWPDLTIVGPGGVLFRELKSATGSHRPEQRQWAVWLAEAGQDVAVWKPRDWESGRIAAELDAIRRPAARMAVSGA
ncbi:VRR-NUC domain-containing protein [Micromonospora sp. NBC_00421]|uniref:VRR-NUC domain-containing protein n=1 Tax=Micromonospora sp. NBC_00421 TaxID=2975976 RepID=UPI002E1A0A83